MIHIPEPTPFCFPPPGAPLIQHVAIYAHWVSLVAAGLVTLIAFQRATKFAPVSHFMIATGMLLVTGAVFAGETLYADLIYQESARALPEVRLGLFGLGACSVSVGLAILPGLAPKRFSWLRVATPALVAVGFLLAGVVQRTGGSSAALAVIGGLFIVAAGALPVLDGRETGRNAQAGAMSCWGFSLLAAGVLVAIGAYCSASDSPVMWDRGALLLTIGEGVFALFILFALFAIEAVAPVKKVTPAPAAGRSVPRGPGALPPPPSRSGSAAVPPPPR